MSLGWRSRLTDSSLSWAGRASSAAEGVINGTAGVSEFVETDLVCTWQLYSGVESDLTLLWQVDADPITAVESDSQLTWQIIADAPTSVEVDLALLWQREEMYVVPSVVGTSQSTATVALRLAGGFVPTFTTSSSPYIAFGDVISTVPPEGSYLGYGAFVELIVSIGTMAPGTGGAGYPVDWQGKRKKLTLKQQPNKHLKKILDDEGKKVLAKRGKKKPLKVKAIKLWP